MTLVRVVRRVRVAAGSSDPLDLPLYDTSRITWLGRFYLPQTASSLNGDAGLGYWASGGIAYNAANNSLFVSAGPESYHEVLGEFSIPTPKTSGTPNTSTQLQSFVQTAGGKQGQVTAGANGQTCTGMLVFGGRLILNFASRYLSEGTQSNCLFARSSLNLATSTVSDAVSLPSAANQRYVSGMGCAVPANWKSTFGNYDAICGGGGGLSIMEQYNCGPGIYFYNPNDIGVTTVGSHKGAEYPWTGAPTSTSIANDFPYAYDDYLWNASSWHRGTIMLPESRTILCFGSHGDSAYVSGVGNVANIKRRNRFWKIDARDLKAAYDGTYVSGTHEVVPYGVEDMDFTTTTNIVPSGDDDHGLTWDDTNRIAYVLEQHGNGSYPAVHALSIPA